MKKDIILLRNTKFEDRHDQLTVGAPQLRDCVHKPLMKLRGPSKPGFRVCRAHSPITWETGTIEWRPVLITGCRTSWNQRHGFVLHLLIHVIPRLSPTSSSLTSSQAPLLSPHSGSHTSTPPTYQTPSHQHQAHVGAKTKTNAE